MAAAICVALFAPAAQAETIGGALAKAYLSNPDINQQRAAVRASDENVPKANAGYLPTVSAEADAGRSSNTTPQGIAGFRQPSTSHHRAATASPSRKTCGTAIERSIRCAKPNPACWGRARQLRNTEQNVLLGAVTYYMDVLRDTAILDLDRNNVEVLQEQLRQTQDRFNVGEVTRTDVAQAEASLAGAQATALTAQSNLQASIANYRQAIGDEPKSLAPVAPVTKPLPKSLSEAVAISQVEHPAIVAMLHGVDAAALDVKVTEGQLYPTVGLTGQLSKRYDLNGLPGNSDAHRLR